MLFKKKKEEFPRLPDLPQLPEIPHISEMQDFSDNQGVHSLPTIPDYNGQETRSQEAIKTELSFQPTVQKKTYALEVDPHENFDFAEQAQNKQIEYHENFPHEEFIERPRAPEANANPIFVRLDRFQSSLKSLGEMKRKIVEIEKVLSDIKELKASEEQELSGWEKEVNELKNNLDKIDKTLFSKI